MGFLDEDIARLQKTKELIQKHEQDKQDELVIEQQVEEDLTQEQVTLAIKQGILERLDEVLQFEKRSFLNNQVTLPIIKEYFEEEKDNDYDITLHKGNTLSIHLSSAKNHGKDMSLIQFKLEFVKVYKKQGIYVSFLEEEEKKLPLYTRKIISFKMASALGFLYHYQVFYTNRQVTLVISFTCLEEERMKWERVIKGMAELIEINWQG